MRNGKFLEELAGKGREKEIPRVPAFALLPLYAWRDAELRRGLDRDLSMSEMKCNNGAISSNTEPHDDWYICIYKKSN